MEGIIFDIKRYAIHDGPGIRTTVFFKGCPLECGWCHNPEGIRSGGDFFFRADTCAPDCRACIEACPSGLIRMQGTGITIDTDRCDLCGLCTDACAYDALAVVGRRVSVDEVICEIEKDRLFFEESGGGVTMSGGEPLAQIAFLEALLRACTEGGYHTTLDTTGHASTENVARIMDTVDLFLYDLKCADDEKHRLFTGVGTGLILDNLRLLLREKKEVVVRIPLIGGLNDDDSEIQAMAKILIALPERVSINFLPYHRGGTEKRRRLLKTTRPESFEAPADSRISEIADFFSQEGFRVKIGG